MFPKKQRIPRDLFPKHGDTKNTWHGTALRVCFYNRNSVSTRFSVVVSKKQYKTIVSRNLFKRRVLSEFEVFKQATLLGRFDKYIIYPKNSVETVDIKTIKTDIHKFINECLK